MHVPRTIEQLPVKRPGRGVEGARIDQHLTSWGAGGMSTKLRGVKVEVQADLVARWSRPVQGSGRRSRFPTQCAQILRNALASYWFMGACVLPVSKWLIVVPPLRVSLSCATICEKAVSGSRRRVAHFESDLSGYINVEEVDLAVRCNQLSCAKDEYCDPRCEWKVAPCGEYTVAVLYSFPVPASRSGMVPKDMSN